MDNRGRDILGGKAENSKCAGVQSHTRVKGYDSDSVTSGSQCLWGRGVEHRLREEVGCHLKKGLECQPKEWNLILWDRADKSSLRAMWRVDQRR